MSARGVSDREPGAGPRWAGRDDARRCQTCHTKIMIPDDDGWVVRNAVLLVSRATGGARAKCPRCKSWVEVPLTYRA